MSGGAPAPPARPAPAGRAALFLGAAAWAGLCGSLHLGGHAPSRPPLPVGGWYAVQAALLLPLAAGMGELAVILGRRLGAARPGALRAALGVGMGAFAGGDAVAWGVLGFGQLGRGSLLAGLIGLGLATAAGARAFDGPRAAPRALLCLLAAALVGSPLLR